MRMTGGLGTMNNETTASGTGCPSNRRGTRNLAPLLCICFLLVLPRAVPSHAGYPAPSEAQCREMVDSMLQTMKTVPVERERDRREARVVLDKAEKIVRDNRQKGVSECETWAAIGKLVVGQ